MIASVALELALIGARHRGQIEVRMHLVAAAEQPSLVLRRLARVTHRHVRIEGAGVVAAEGTLTV